MASASSRIPPRNTQRGECAAFCCLRSWAQPACFSRNSHRVQFRELEKIAVKGACLRCSAALAFDDDCDACAGKSHPVAIFEPMGKGFAAASSAPGGGSAAAAGEHKGGAMQSPSATGLGSPALPRKMAFQAMRVFDALDDEKESKEDRQRAAGDTTTSDIIVSVRCASCVPAACSLPTLLLVVRRA